MREAELWECMAFFIKQFLTFCALAGMATAVIHKNVHPDHDGCAHSHEHHDHGGHDHHPQPNDHDDHDGSQHHHHCCHIPVADRPTLDHQALITFHRGLLGIPSERSLIPDEPFFSLDKPPLI
jgi:hypothetical protein